MSRDQPAHLIEPPCRLIVLMGVSGTGKSTVGTLLAARLGAAFLEGDDLHPKHNVEKMKGGQALTDADRQPWLAALAERIATARAARAGLVVACSALKRPYRDVLRAAAPELLFIHLTGARATLAARLAARRGHFMPPALLESQLATLEPLTPDEHGFTCSFEPPPEQVVADILGRLSSDLS